MTVPTSNWYILLIMLVCYLIGSIPFGLILTRLAGLGDVRAIGSGNIGATNVLRTGNKKIAILTLLCDMLKGTLAVFIASLLLNLQTYSYYVLLAGFLAFLGHLFPIWLNFKGGKGVATYLGVCLGIYWPCALVFIFTWLTTAYVTRYSSLSALIAVILVPIFIIVSIPSLIGFIVATPFIAMTIIVIIKHKENIKRLKNGSESKIGAKN